MVVALRVTAAPLKVEEVEHTACIFASGVDLSGLLEI